MKRSSKVILTAVTVVGLSLASLSYVSANGRYDRCGYGQGPMSMQDGGKGQWGRHGFGHGRSGDPVARMGQGLDMMKYKLRITEAQEPAWQAFEQSMQQKMNARMEQRQAARESGVSITVPDRIERMRNGAVQITEMADAIEKLYAGLTPEQQKIADAMRPMGGMGRMR